MRNRTLQAAASSSRRTLLADASIARDVPFVSTTGRDPATVRGWYAQGRRLGQAASRTAIMEFETRVRSPMRDRPADRASSLTQTTEFRIVNDPGPVK